MEDYTIQTAPPTECCVTHRAFQPGEEYVAVLFEMNGNLTRRDYSLEAWKEHPPEKYSACWHARIPVQSAAPRRSREAINDVLLEMFDHLREQYSEPDKLYILSLLLVRRRIMRLEDSFEENAEEVLRLYSQNRDEYYKIPVVTPTPERQAEIQAELTAILTGDAPHPPQKMVSPEEEQTVQIWNPDEIELPEVKEIKINYEL